MIEQHAGRSADKTALVCDNEALSYGAMVIAVRAVGTALRGLGVTSEVKVGVCIDRSPWLAIMALGVYWAGGTYVPLSMQNPPERMASLVANAGVSVVLTRDHLSAAQNIGNASVTTVEELLGRSDSDMEAIATAAPSSWQGLVAADAAAYVIHTSGTSGRPKGVLVERGSLAAFVARTIDLYDLQPSDRCLQFADIGFDVSLLEIFCCLCAGGSLRIAGDLARADPVELGALLHEDAITFADLPPSLVSLMDPRDAPHLRLLSVGGEPCPPDVINAWLERGCRVVNSYGPTEATIAVTTMECRGRYDRPAPIGRPMANQRAYVLDPKGHPCPHGEPGELFIAGDQLARGYLDDPDATSAAFVADRFVAGARMYKTGDIVRWNEARQLEFVGRVDRQVKVRGVRIELEEVEATLTSHPAVTQAAVVHWDKKSGSRSLAAFVVTNRPLENQELRDFAARRLPPSAVPETVRAATSLPMTPNGKVDLSALLNNLSASEAARPQLSSPARDL